MAGDEVRRFEKVLLPCALFNTNTLKPSTSIPLASYITSRKSFDEFTRYTDSRKDKYGIE